MGGLCAFSASEARPKRRIPHYCMSDLPGLCEVVHTWARNTRGTLRARGFTIGGDHVQHTRRGALRFLQAWPSHQTQSTDKGYVFCRAEIPIGVCDRCGAKHWNQVAEAIIEEVVRREYDKLR
jgi:hypothetical protein